MRIGFTGHILKFKQYLYIPIYLFFFFHLQIDRIIKQLKILRICSNLKGNREIFYFPNDFFIVLQKTLYYPFLHCCPAGTVTKETREIREKL